MVRRHNPGRHEEVPAETPDTAQNPAQHQQCHRRHPETASRPPALRYDHALLSLFRCATELYGPVARATPTGSRTSRNPVRQVPGIQEQPLTLLTVRARRLGLRRLAPAPPPRPGHAPYGPAAGSPHAGHTTAWATARHPASGARYAASHRAGRGCAPPSARAGQASFRPCRGGRHRQRRDGGGEPPAPGFPGLGRVLAAGRGELRRQQRIHLTDSNSTSRLEVSLPRPADTPTTPRAGRQHDQRGGTPPSAVATPKAPDRKWPRQATTALSAPTGSLPEPSTGLAPPPADRSPGPPPGRTSRVTRLTCPSSCSGRPSRQRRLLQSRYALTESRRPLSADQAGVWRGPLPEHPPQQHLVPARDSRVHGGERVAATRGGGVHRPPVDRGRTTERSTPRTSDTQPNPAQPHRTAPGPPTSCPTRDTDG